jgi:hypothetical protein
MEKLTQDKKVTIAKRITRKLCIVNKVHWHELLQYEQAICKPEDSWSFRNWIVFMLNLGLTEDQIYSTAQQRLRCASDTKASHTDAPGSLSFSAR